MDIGPHPRRDRSLAVAQAMLLSGFPAGELSTERTATRAFVPLTIFLALYTSRDISARQASHLANVYEIQVAWDGMLER